MRTTMFKNTLLILSMISMVHTGWSANVDAILIEAHILKHQEETSSPITYHLNPAPTEQYHLGLLLQDGRRMEAVGTASEIRSE